MRILLLLIGGLFIWSQAAIGMELVGMHRQGKRTSVGAQLRKVAFDEARGEEGRGIPVAQMMGTISGTGEFFSSIEVGGKSFYVQVDTGSVALAVPGDDCETTSGDDCPAHDHYDNDERWVACSETQCPVHACSSASASCPFGLFYGDGSHVTGRQASDTVKVGPWSAQMRFGVIQSESDNFILTTVDGIMGLAPEAVDPMNGQSFADQAIQQNGLADVFCMCTGTIGGAFALGTNGSGGLYSGPAQYVPLDTNGLFLPLYGVRMTSVVVGGAAIAASSMAPAIVDSGTTLLLLESALFQFFEQRVRAQMGSLIGSSGKTLFDGYCYSYSLSTIASFPTVDVVLANGTAVVVPPTNYLVRLPYMGLYLTCLGVVDGGSYTILGDVALQAYTVVYDRAHSRIGFAPKGECPEPAVSASAVQFNGEPLPGGSEALPAVASAPLNVEAGFFVRVQYSDEGLAYAGMPVRFVVDNSSADASLAGFQWAGELMDEYPYGDSVVVATDEDGVAMALFKQTRASPVKVRAYLDAVPDALPIVFSTHPTDSQDLGAALSVSIFVLACCVFLVFVVCVSFLAVGVVAFLFLDLRRQRKVAAAASSSNFDYSASFIVPDEDTL